MMSRGGRGSGEWTPAGIIARLRSLIEAKDGGDVRRAAGRFGVAPEAIAELPAALADDARDQDARAATVLAAAARAYDVDATWLVTGHENFHGEQLAPAARLRVAEILSHVGQRLLAARRNGTGAPSHRL
jgi:hypothetical protein